MEDQENNPSMEGHSITVPKYFSILDDINIKGFKICQEFIEHFKQEYNVIILGISSNFKSIIQIYIPNKTKKLPLKIEEIYENKNGLIKDQICLYHEISRVIYNVNVIMPKIKYIFK